MMAYYGLLWARNLSNQFEIIAALSWRPSGTIYILRESSLEKLLIKYLERGLDM